MKIQILRNVGLSLLILAVGAAGLAIQATTASAAPTNCGGTVFHDFDHDGEIVEDYSHVSNDYASVADDPVPGINVTITTVSGTTISATTDANGDWTANLDTTDFPIRIDFSGLPNSWVPTPKGPNSDGLTQHVPNAAACGSGAVGSTGISAPNSFCESQPELHTSCFLFGNVPNHDNEPAVVSTLDGAIDNLSTAGSGFQVTPLTIEATLGEVGTVYGLDNNTDTDAVFVGSFVKRHTQLGPTDNPTTIYRLDPSGAVAPWYTVDQSAANPHSGATDGWLRDNAAYDDVGRAGLGDVEISPDNSTLYTVDLGNKELVAVPINANGTPGTATTTPITAAALPGLPCGDQDLRPFGLGWSEVGELLVGATCTAESTVAPGSGPTTPANPLGDATQLSAHVYTFSGGAFSLLTNVPLNATNRGTQNAGGGAQGDTDWRPWTTEPPYAQNFTGWPGGGITYPQPLLTDIEVDGGDLVIGFMDIWGHQVGSNAFYETNGTEYRIDQPLSTGDIVRAVSDGAGGYSYPDDGTDYFYTGDNYNASHEETALGSSAQIPGRPYVIATAFDPVDPNQTWQSGGLEWFANETIGNEGAGEHVRGYRVYDGGPGPSDVGTFEKAAGIGDVQALCGAAPIEVGDYVWFDADGDGIADPGEQALDGVVIELLDDQGNVLATATTDANGLYSFHTDNVAGFDRHGDYVIQVAQDNYDAGGVFAAGGAHDGKGFLTTTDSGSDDANDNDGALVGGLPTISFTATQTDHTMDFGFVDGEFDLALQKFYTSDTTDAPTDGIIEPGADVTFTITVTNQGTITSQDFRLFDWLPTGFTLNDTDWVPLSNNRARFDFSGSLTPGDAVDIPITMTAGANLVPGEFVNVAEIRLDDGDDIDSTPDTNQANDNQPAAPGDATDNVIDNTAGDEDDHDIAGVTLVLPDYDLALTKVYTSDTFNNTTDGIIEQGEDVTFTITVENQGDADATTFEVTDFIPAGFVLNDTAWTANGAGTQATIDAGPLAAGASTDIRITLTADNVAPGEFVNWAEISDDDGDDIDSTPDANQGNDNQPTGPGAAGDNVTNNAGGDEDDHDPAGVSVANFDLALTKVLATGQASVIEPGDDVDFTITVENQGTIDANSFEITDYLPAGFTLNDADWTANGAGTRATFDGGPLAAGATVDINITMTAGTATGDFVNWAEISSDDGNDIDSTPDANQGNDSQPAGPGAPTDNVTDNTGGDEDDHDPAGVSVASFDLALRKVYDSDTSGAPTDGVIEPGADVTFTITVFNQGSTNATSFEVTDYLPAGFTLNDAAWTANGAGTRATFDGGPLAAGASTTIDITLTAGTATGDFANWAEISSDSGDDIDSTPDANQGNDNQPTGPGAAGDDVINNAGGDEDDHDVAPISVEFFDLALTKVYTSDTFNNTTDAIIEQGSDVTFTITVTNQGTIDANSFTVTDFLPAGFVLNDAAWTAGAGNTATFVGGPLAAGTSTTIPITMTADSVAPGEFVNWAEISSDDGNDVDSTPDANQANDNQPVGPGEPTDDVTDNSTDANGDPDEDDHDPAGVSVANFDLALTKVYTSDTAGDTTDGVIVPGADVTFTITVENQGTIDAATFDVTDFLPAGFTLNDSAWTDNGDDTATIAGGPLAAGASTDINITMTAGTATGDFVNWAEISSDDGNDVDSTPDANQANDSQPAGPGAPTDDVTDNTAGDEDDHDPAPVSVEIFDLALIKVFTSDSFGDTTDGVIADGSDATFTITVTNQGSVDASTFDVTDYVPAGFVLNDAAWTDNGDGTATIAGGPLAAGATEDIEITLTANGAADGDYVNWAEISDAGGDDVDSTPNTNPADDVQPAGPGAPTDNVIDNTAGDEDDHDPAPITVATFDLALQKVYTSDTFANTSDAIIEQGGDATFTITVTNQGSQDATSFEVTDYLPAGFVLNDAAWTDNGDGTASISGGPLAAGATEDITITMTADSVAPGEFVNWAEISSDDGDDVDSTPDANQANDNQPAAPGDATDDVIDNTGGDEDDHDLASVSVANFDLALTKVYTSDTFGADDGIIEPGTDVTFTITVENQGTIDAASFEVTDFLPAGFRLNDGAWTDNGTTATFTGGPLAAGASTNINITMTAGTAPGDFVNWAEISSDDGNDIDSTPDANQANDSQPAGPGAPTDNVTDNTAGDEDDHDPAPITVALFDLALTKVYTSDTLGDSGDGIIAQGSDVTFTITVTNQGDIDASSFEVTDYLPAGFSLNDGAWTDNGTTATFTGGPLAAGVSVDIPITLTADSATPGAAVNWAEISSDGGGTDVDSTPDANQANDAQPAGPNTPGDNVTDNTGGDEDDHDPAGVSVALYDLALRKVYKSDTFDVDDDGIIQAGSDATFTITVTNQGTIAANSFEVTDFLPAGFVLNDAAWTASANGTSATITAGPLAPLGSMDLEITLTAVGPVVGELVNVAEISADDGPDSDSTPDADQGNDNQPAVPGDPTDDVINNAGGDEDDHDIAGLTVVEFDLALVKVFTSDTFGDTSDGVIENGTDVTFTITVENQGSVDANTFTVTDYLPAGFSLNDAAWTDNGTTATFTGRPLAAGQSVEIPITLTADSAAPGDAVNWAEISSDDGEDIDSTPDANQGNDNQPAGPGVAGDDVTDNAGGDEDDHDPAGVQIVNFDLALTKVYTSDTHDVVNDGVVENGADVTFTITVENQGSVDANTFTVTDYLPAGFSLNDAAWTDNGTTATFAGGPLAVGVSVDIPITLTADSASPGDHVNWAEISSDDGNDIDSAPDANQGNDNQPAGPGVAGDDVTNNAGGDEDDHDPAGVSVEVFDLALRKVYTSDTFGDPGDAVIDTAADVTFTITVFNQGTVDANTFTVTDYLPAGFTLNDPAWTASANGTTATIDGGPLVAGDSTDFTITMTAGTVAPGTFVNRAEISSDDANDADSTPNSDPGDDAQPSSPGDPTDNVIDNAAGDEDDHDIAGVGVENFDLALIKMLSDDGFGDPADGLTEAGSDVTFTITVINQGTIDAGTFEVTDYLPAGFVVNDGDWTDNGTTATFTGGPLAAGDSVDIPITLTADAVASGGAVNLAEISADDGADIDSTPDADPTDDGQPGAPGDPTDDITNNDAGDSDDHDIAGVQIGEFDLALQKVYTSDTSVDGQTADGAVQVGDEATFTITVTNQGTLDASTFDVTDYFPPGFVLSATSPDNTEWTDNGDDTATITAGPLVVGASVDLTITLVAETASAGQVVNLAEISADDANDVDSTPDTDPADDNQPAAPGDNTDNVTDNTNGDEDDHDIAGLIIDEYDLAIAKDFTSDTSADGNAGDGVIQPGDDATFTVTVTNQGTVDAADVEITDYLPAGFVLSATAADSAAWTDNGDGTATTSVGAIAATESVSVTITITAIATGAGPLVNVVEISSDDGDDVDSTPDTDPDNEGGPGGEDDIDDAPLTVDAYDLALTKVYTSDTLGNATDGIIEIGADITFTITVFNQGTVDASDIEVTDFYPSGFELSAVSSDSDAWTDNGDGTAVTTIAAIAAGGSATVDITLTAINPTLGENINAAEISNDDGRDIDSTPNADVGDDGNITDNEIDNANGDEDDHDPAPFTVVEETVPVFDLALRKTLQDGSNSASVAVGDTVTWTITVFNQGEVAASDIDVIDYIPSGLDLADTDWTEDPAGNATVNIAGPIVPGAQASVDITTTVVDGSDLENVAEIAAAVATDVNGSVLTLANGDPILDIDSIPDASNSDSIVDDEINNVGGDEDDHDGALLVLASAETPPDGPLALTGRESWTLALYALVLLAAGFMLTLIVRRRDDEQTV